MCIVINTHFIKKMNLSIFFFKGLAHHCVGTNDYFTIRCDSEQTFIEAELACIYDKEGTTPKIIVTGSAQLDTYRKMGDSLAGRYFQYRILLNPNSSHEPRLEQVTVQTNP